MEALAVLFVLATVAVVLGVPIVAFVVGLTAHRDLRRLRTRVLDLEHEVDQLRRTRPAAPPAPTPAASPAPTPAASPAPTPAAAPAPTPAAAPAPPPPPSPARPPPAARGPAPAPPPPPRPDPPVPPTRTLTPERLVVTLASALGGFALLLAALFFLGVAIERGWLGPAPRVALGLTAGVLAWHGGAWARPRGYRWLGSALSGAGMGVLFGVLYAAHARYGLVGQAPTFVLLCAVSAVAIGTAVRHDDRAMAWLGLVGGALTPVLVSSGENRPGVLFSYVGVLSAATLWVAARRRWPDLVAGAAGVVAVLFLGWTASWYRPDQVPVAVTAALLLSAPFAVVAARSKDALVGILAGIATLGVGGLVAPWVVPVDPSFVDPVTATYVVRDLGSAPWWAAAAVLLAPVPALAVARVRQHPEALGLVAVAATALSLGAAVGWADHGAVPAAALALMLAGPLVTVAAATTGWPAAGWAWLVTPLGLGLGLAVGVGQGVVGPGLLAVSLGTMLAAGARVSWRSGEGAVPAVTLVGATLPLAVAAGDLDAIGVTAVAGAATLTWASLATFPLVARWRVRGPVAHATAALAAPALFWPLHEAWTTGLGDPVIGVLPLLLGLGALLGAATLVRTHRAGRDSGALALMVGVALAGVTAAVPLQLTDGWLTVAWGLEAAALAWAASRLRHPLVPWAALALAAAVTVRLCLNPWALEYGDTTGPVVLNWTLYTWGIPLVALLGAARLLPRGDSAPAARRHGPGALVLMAIAIGFALVNVQVSHAFQDAGPVELGGHSLLQGMVRSLGWAAYGVTVLVAGLRREGRAVRMIGFGLVLLAAGKVFLVDLWSLSGFARVGSVLGLGVSLLLAAFLFERLVLRGAPDDPKEAP